ncbi:uncharacterized protein K452DRAFT_235327 [Aplosporella prunicola CBS 121167]|uniref:FAD-binding domain-containing protein n=1 Tax=Aplosporella prunicola CBS 121167 TaxID=1176127 RepID=A0A6A6B0P4_9PEZI|nr:uncharacterized protein K452DRAFT_235327 [Aplosporella prunicola CBS 121167]KAF2137749.1 hypothetical protein K452DRAFT_235327 [Aplosporella prunicola CBS 121167]
MAESRPFRVIVVGGGVGGLAASHALQKADIDHIVLEKGEIAPARGASIGIYPHGSRILQQFGCLEEVENECNPLGKSLNLLPDGRVIANSNFFGLCREYHGYPIPVLERRRFLEILYEKLPDKSRVRAGVGVVDITDSDDNVKAVLADGTIEEGDLLIGSDGVHSLIRSLMWRNANAAIPGLITTTEKKSLFTDWSALIGFSPTLPSMSNCNVSVTHYPGRSFLVLGQKKYTFWFVFFRNSERLYWPHSPRWTQADAEKRAVECLECPISNTHVFGELWKQRVRAELVNVEEGLFKHMFFGRVVLSGDAVHKMTPNIGLGGNSSMESIVVLTNLLHRAIKDYEARGTKPKKAAIEALLYQYQAERTLRMRQIIDFSALATKVQAWENLGYKIMSRVMPLLPENTFALKTSKLIKAAPKLDFVATPLDTKATIPWEDSSFSVIVPTKPYQESTLFSSRKNCLSVIFVLLLFSFLLL